MDAAMTEQILGSVRPEFRARSEGYLQARLAIASGSGHRHTKCHRPIVQVAQRNCVLVETRADEAECHHRRARCGKQNIA
jgi:hypothetical protein